MSGMPKTEHSTRPTTLKALYAQITGDTTTHQRTIDAAYRKLDARQHLIIRERLAGKSYHEIAAAEQVTAATVRDVFLRAVEAIRKAAHHEPRYNRVGRKHGGKAD